MANTGLPFQKYLSEKNSVLICSLDGIKQFAHNEDKPFRSASVIKLFILGYYIHNNVPLDMELTIPKKKMIGTSIITELKITSATVYELLCYMIASSDNTATNILIEYASFEAINDYIKNELGCENTVLARKMLDMKAAAEGRDNYTSLMDVHCVMTRMMLSKTARDIMAMQKGNERIRRYMYDMSIKYYGKGGDLPDVYNDAAIIGINEKYVFAGVLSNGFEKGSAKRLCGMVGLEAINSAKPLV